MPNKKTYFEQIPVDIVKRIAVDLPSKKRVSSVSAASKTSAQKKSELAAASFDRKRT